MGKFLDLVKQWERENMPLVEQAQPEPTGMAKHDPAAWGEDFHRWALSQCVFQDRCFGGIGSLHRDFCEFQIRRDEVPCSRAVFDLLLHDGGFMCADGLVYGLILSEDLIAVRHPPD